MKCFVTGGTGLLGAHLLAHLCKNNAHKIVALKRKTTKFDMLHYIFSFYQLSQTDLNKIDWVEGNVLDSNVLHLAMQDVDVVYHCAADVLIGNSNGNVTEETNINGTKNVVDSALLNNVKIFCHVSSVAAIGKVANGSIANENTPWTDTENLSPYAVSKYISEQYVLSVDRSKMRVIVVNPGVIIGVSNKTTGSSAIISLARKGLPFYLPGGSAYVDVADVCKAMIQLVDSDITHERFILVSENVSTKSILRYFSKGFKTVTPFIKIPKFVMLFLSLVFEKFMKIFGKPTSFDRKAVNVACNYSYYSSEKIKQIIGFEFMPIANTIAIICKHTLSYNSSNKSFTN